MLPSTSPYSLPRALRETACLQAAARLQSILDCASSLLRDGYRIIRPDVQSLSVKPVIWIEVEPRLAGLIQRDQAIYYMRGHDEAGPYLIGQFERCGCRVQWRERGH